MIKRTRWGPDTCGCVVEYAWDNAVAESVRTHTFSQIVSRCPIHEALSLDGESLYDQLLSENQTKNRALDSIIEILPAVNFEKYSWTFDASRNLRVSLAAEIVVSPQNRTAIQAALDSRFGSGKVTLV